jgi:hypothetical protein
MRASHVLLFRDLVLATEMKKHIRAIEFDARTPSSTPSSRAFFCLGWRPVAARPAVNSEPHLIASVLRERHAQAFGTQAQGFDTCADEGFRQPRPLLRRSAAPDVAFQDSGRLGIAITTPPKASFGQLAERHGDYPGGRLHDAGIEIAKAAG